MELIEKYLYAVGKKLPLKQKDDILKELRSIIMDNLDDITGGKDAKDEDVSKVLLEMGPPSEVAKSYRSGPSWLIGPTYYDLYMLIVKIVLAVTFGGYMISLVVSMFTQTSGGWEIIWRFVGQIFAIIPGLLSAIGIVTLIFAVIERAVKEPLDIDMKNGEKWTPEKLEPVPQKEEIVKPLEAVLGIVFPVIFLIILNFYRDRIGIYYMPEGASEWVMVNIFNPSALSIYIPLWSLTMALSIGLHGWLLSTGRHNTGTKIFEIVITALNTGILFYIANGPKLLEFGVLKGDLEGLQPVLNFVSDKQHLIFTILAVLTLIGLLTQIGKFIYNSAKKAMD